MTWGEFDRCLKGYRSRLETEVKIGNSLNHTLGRYISFAFNQPSKYPKEPFPMTEAERDQIDRARTTVATTDDQRVALARIKYGRKQ